MRTLLATLFVCAGTCTLAAQQAASTTPCASGIWQGNLDLGAMHPRLGLTIARDSTGVTRASITSIDEGGNKVPATCVAHADMIDVSFAGAVYSARLTQTGDSLIGSFSQGPAVVPLRMARVASLASAAARPQDPKPPFPYRSEDVTVESTGGVRLACTVDLPQGSGPFPGVVMASGSGPQDRDENLAGHKPFLVIADYLARRGIASLRCDDRGFAKSTGNYAAASVTDFAADAEAGVKYLRTRRDIAGTKVGILGHSEGGMIGPMVASHSNDVAFVVMLAGPGIRGDSLLVLQGALIGKAGGVPDSVLRRQAERQHVFFAAVTGARDSADADARLHHVEDSITAAAPVSAQASARRQLAITHAQFMSREIQEILMYDPRPVLSKVRVPVLALNGTLDLQVPYAEDLAGLEAGLKAAGNRDVTTIALPGLNHLFQPAKTGAPSEYMAIETTIAPVALETIAAWIGKRFGQ